MDKIMETIVKDIHFFINTFTAIVDLSRSNFSIARAPLLQLKSAMQPVVIGGKLTQQLQYI